ncbi:glycosyltransferase family 4 protein [Streptomyces luteolifulvus]|uniref:Glycosyltransferase family 4 protein n=1 Tax=Streptomyces luteolifulvus TaxID=2615112 RepID=A0A6H9URE1_9ACTN|nr:glycosyltransferase [Streptomyces luteolifulvus]KAB1140759.1 glycosyltransferase family 4 protein [Streptomyces luteolifulvus]
MHLRIMRVIARMNIGGPALQVSALMRGLDTERFDHRLFAGSVGPDEADYLETSATDVAVTRMPFLGRAVRPADDVRALRELVAAMRHFRPHIVHTHTAKAGALGRVAAVAARVPARVHTFHGHLLHGYFSPRKTRLVVHAERGLARGTDRLVAVGAKVRDELLAAGIGRTQQYAVVPPGTVLPAPPERSEARRMLGLPEDAPVVAYVGRVTQIKRPDRFLAVAQEVRRAVPGAHFVMCGEGDLGTALRQHSGLDGALHHLGWRTDVETVYAAADVVLLTSDNEGMPVSLIEAGQAGVPVVATDVGSVAEVVRDGETGLLCAPDAPELAHHTVRLLGDPHLRRHMGERARSWSTSRFGAQRLVDDTHRLYASIAVARGWWPAPTESQSK